MSQFILRRVLLSIVSLALITLIVFTMTQAIGDPVAVLLPPTATEADRVKFREYLGLDKPLPVQYVRFMGRAMRGDFGKSYFRGRSVIELLAERLPATLELAILSTLFALILGIPLGVIAAVRPNSLAARGAMWGSMVGISLPTFWLGLLLMMYFGVVKGWLPPQGRGATREMFGMNWSALTVDGLRHLILPAVTLALHHVAMLIRLTRSELLDTLQMPFIRVARAFGVPERTIIARHAMRHAAIPIVTVVGVEFGQLVAFSVVTESVFEWPGLGKLLIESIKEVDRPVIITYILLTGAAFVLINLLVDLTYALAESAHTPLSTGGGGGTG